MPKRNPETEARRSKLIVLMELERGTLTQIRQLIKESRIERHLPVRSTTIYRALERLAAQAAGCRARALRTKFIEVVRTGAA